MVAPTSAVLLLLSGAKANFFRTTTQTRKLMNFIYALAAF
jgi:hypothetical protein